MVKKLTSKPSKKISPVAVFIVVGFALTGSIIHMSTKAGTPFFGIEPENGTLSAPATKVTDTAASGGVAIKFGSEPISPPPPTTYSCTKNLAVGGNIQSFSDSLASGQTGCLRGGTYNTGSLTFRSSGATLASTPGERAIINMGTSGSTVSSSTSGMVLKRLDFVTTNVHTMRIFGSRTVLENNYFTNKNATTAGACVGVGGSADRPDAVIIRGNKFDKCGGDKLNHGIYALSNTNMQITDNIFWGSGGYNIQLYPQADRAVVRHNVIDGSREMSTRGGVVIDGTWGGNHTLEYNVLAYANFDAAIIQRVVTGNKANSNCFFGNNANTSGSGITVTGSVNADPKFVNRTGRDYRLASGSGCLSTVQYDTAAKINAVW